MTNTQEQLHLRDIIDFHVKKYPICVLLFQCRVTSTSCPHYAFFARVRLNIDSLHVQHCHKMCITPRSLVVSFYLRTHVIGATQHENDFTEFCLLYFFFLKTHLINLKVINDHITEHSLLRQNTEKHKLHLVQYSHWSD